MRTYTGPFLSISSSSQEPRAGIRLAMKHLLLPVLGLHDVGARGADQLRHDDRSVPLMMNVPRSVIHGEVAHEDRLLADLARLPVDEGDRGRRPTAAST